LAYFLPGSASLREALSAEFRIFDDLFRTLWFRSFRDELSLGTYYHSAYARSVAGVFAQFWTKHVRALAPACPL
jgi:hypothetical protein